MKEDRYTDYDFSKHDLIIKKNDLVTIHWLKIPNTMTYNIKFINCEGIMTVTGDYGNWVFCRSFIPSGGKESHADIGYWSQKLRINSVQDSHLWDEDKVAEEVDSILKNDDYELSEDEVEELNSMKDCSSYEEFMHVAFSSHIDYELMPRGKIINPRLLLICDAFNEICKRMASNDPQNN